MKNKPSSNRAQKRLTKHLEQINLYAAGVDIGSENHYVAVPVGLDDEAVRYCQLHAKSVRLQAWKMPSSYTKDTDFIRQSSVTPSGSLRHEVAC